MCWKFSEISTLSPSLLIRAMCSSRDSANDASFHLQCLMKFKAPFVPQWFLFINHNSLQVLVFDPSCLHVTGFYVMCVLTCLLAHAQLCSNHFSVCYQQFHQWNTEVYTSVVWHREMQCISGAAALVTSRGLAENDSLFLFLIHIWCKGVYLPKPITLIFLRWCLLN